MDNCFCNVCFLLQSGFADGASSSVHLLLSAMIKDAKDTFLVPVPQYPLYSAALTLYGGTLVPYFLDEDSGWKIDVDGISASIAELKQRGLRVRGIVVINPGNPTGQVLSLENQVCYAGCRSAACTELCRSCMLQPCMFQLQSICKAILCSVVPVTRHVHHFCSDNSFCRAFSHVFLEPGVWSARVASSVAVA